MTYTFQTDKNPKSQFKFILILNIPVGRWADREAGDVKEIDWEPKGHQNP